MGVFTPSSSGVPPPIPGVPPVASPRMQAALAPLQTKMKLSGVDAQLQQRPGQPGPAPQRQAQNVDIGENTIGIGNPSAMTGTRAR